MVRCEHCLQEHDDESRFCPQTGRLFAPARFFPPGTVLQNSYRLERVLGTEGVVVLVAATHLPLNKPVHVRMLVPNPALEGSAVDAALKYARMASATRHRNLLSVDDIGRSPGGFLFLVTEPARGRTLREICDGEAPLVPSRAAWLISELLAGLQVIHNRGVSHRDPRPGEVLVVLDHNGDEVVKLMDIGLHLLRRAAASSGPGPDPDLAYLPPEQVRGEPGLDVRSDTYVCGAVLYHLVTGSPPFTAADHEALAAAIVAGEVLPPSGWIRDIPEGLSRAVLTALARTRGRRPPDATAFRRALRPFRQQPRGATVLGVGQPAVAPPTDSEPTAPPDLDLTRPLKPSRPVEVLPPAGQEQAQEDQLAMTLKDHAALDATVLMREGETAPAPELPELDSEPVVAAPASDPPPGLPGVELAPPPFAGEIPGTADPPPQEETESEPQVRISQMVERGVVPLDDNRSDAAAPPPGIASGPPVGLAAESRDEEPVPLDLEPPIQHSLHEVRSRPLRTTQTVGGTMYRSARRGGLLSTRRVVLAVVLLVGAVLAYHFRDPLGRKLGFATDYVQDEISDDSVLLLVETYPKRARVYVDGVERVSRPIQVPQSRTRTFELRVEAPGYRTRKMQIKADRTRVIRVVLKRRR
jgi:serine/threonine-protein kinase